MNLRFVIIFAAVCGLALIMIITCLYAAGVVLFENYTLLLLIGSLIWFTGILLANLVRKKLTGLHKNKGS